MPIVYTIILIAVVASCYNWLKNLIRTILYPELPVIEACPYDMCDGSGWYDEVGLEPDDINTKRCLCNKELDFTNASGNGDD